MSAASRLTVHTNCPNCGAAIDFGEGTNALSCDHCRSRLLVTGHGRILSYFVSPRIDAALAVSLARFAQGQDTGPIRTGAARLFFLPYYRMTGTDVRWQRPDPEPPRPSDFTEANAGNESLVTTLIAALAERDRVDEIECRDRAIERNFLALDVPGVGLYSLGMRPNALRLELYHRDALQGLGHVVGVEMPSATALAIGRKTGDGSNVACRVVLGAVLSIVYFPFWFVEIRRPQSRLLTIVDAVSQSVVENGAPADRLERFGRAVEGDPDVIGLRPLVCPNCGWDLPVEPVHVIFYCGSCHRAWRIRGDELTETAHRFIAPPEPTAQPVAEHLPFWALRAAVGEDEAGAFLAPAFRYRQARALVEVTRRLSTFVPPPTASVPAPPRARGASFDEADAAALVLLAQAGGLPRSFARAENYREISARVLAAELVWLPFLSDVYTLRDPFRGTAITAKLLA